MINTVKIPNKSPTKKLVDSRQLGSIISFTERELGGVGDYRDITSFIRNRLNLDVSEDEVINFYTPMICEIESELLYRQYGY